MKAPLWSRVESKLEKIPESGCWLFMGATNQFGYGRLTLCRKGVITRHLAHRVSYEHHNGPIPPDKIVCHKCDIPSCVNPAHLFLGTHQDNVTDKMRKGRYKGSRITSRVTRLSPVQVNEIRASTAGRRALARQYGVHHKTIAKILDGVTWKHLLAGHGFNGNGGKFFDASTDSVTADHDLKQTPSLRCQGAMQQTEAIAHNKDQKS